MRMFLAAAVLAAVAWRPAAAEEARARLPVLAALDKAGVDALSRRAEAGEAQAMVLLGEAEGLGYGGLVPDAAAAHLWLSRAAASGRPDVAREAEFFRFQSVGATLIRRSAEAVERAERGLAGAAPAADAPDPDLVALADVGVADAQVLLARQYEAGSAAPKDPALAALWWERAAAAGDPRGEHALGGVYARGGDAKAARRHWRAAADKGYAPAQMAMAAACLDGTGGPRDPAEAGKWVLLAAAGGSAAAREAVDGLASIIGRDAMDEAGRRAAAWKAAD
jgi:TPR repeat protein